MTMNTAIAPKVANLPVDTDEFIARVKSIVSEGKNLTGIQKSKLQVLIVTGLRGMVDVKSDEYKKAMAEVKLYHPNQMIQLIEAALDSSSTEAVEAVEAVEAKGVTSIEETPASLVVDEIPEEIEQAYYQVRMALLETTTLAKDLKRLCNEVCNGTDIKPFKQNKEEYKVALEKWSELIVGKYPSLVVKPDQQPANKEDEQEEADFNKVIRYEVGLHIDGSRTCTYYDLEEARQELRSWTAEEVPQDDQVVLCEIYADGRVVPIETYKPVSVAPADPAASKKVIKKADRKQLITVAWSPATISDLFNKMAAIKDEAVRQGKVKSTKNPSMTLATSEGFAVVINKTKSNGSAKDPGSIYIKVVSKDDDTWVYNLQTDGTLRTNSKVDRSVLVALDSFLLRFCDNPAKVAAESGKISTRCCVCSLTLNDPLSLSIGYGKKCAENLGWQYGHTTELSESLDKALQSSKAESKILPLTIDWKNSESVCSYIPEPNKGFIEAIDNLDIRKCNITGNYGVFDSKKILVQFETYKEAEKLYIEKVRAISAELKEKQVSKNAIPANDEAFTQQQQEEVQSQELPQPSALSPELQAILDMASRSGVSQEQMFELYKLAINATTSKPKRSGNSTPRTPRTTNDSDAPRQVRGSLSVPAGQYDLQAVSRGSKVAMFLEMILVGATIDELVDAMQQTVGSVRGYLSKATKVRGYGCRQEGDKYYLVFPEGRNEILYR